MKRKVVAILLLFCLLAPVAATFTILHYQRMRIRKMVKQQIIPGIPREKLVLLKFSAKETQTKLSWKHSGEFGYNSRMYDVVDTEIHGDTTYYWCHPDKKETRLNRQMVSMLSHILGKSPQQRKHQQRLVNFFRSLYFQQFQAWKPLQAIAGQLASVYLLNAISISYPPPVPPPVAA